jgi:hypothetical protein
MPIMAAELGIRTAILPLVPIRGDAKGVDPSVQGATTGAFAFAPIAGLIALVIGFPRSTPNP